MHFSLRFNPSSEAKLVISVSKKVAKKAITRNKIKRRVRAVFRNIISRLKTGTYLIVAKIGSENIKGKELENELLKLLAKNSKL